jgi:hypothetical protein
VKRSSIAALPVDPLYGFGALRTLPPRPFTGAAASTTGAGTGFSTVAWHDISKAMRCLPMLMMMRFWGSMTGCGEAGADWGKGITLVVMTGDCTSHPPAKVRSLAAFAVAYLVGRSKAPGASAALFFAAARRQAT